MATLILIVQTYTGVLAYEYGPYPNTDSCEKSAIQRISEIEAGDGILKVVGDCRLLYPELDAIAENEDY